MARDGIQLLGSFYSLRGKLMSVANINISVDTDASVGTTIRRYLSFAVRQK